MKFDLREFCAFQPQQSSHDQPRLSVNEKGDLAMNGAFRKKVGAVREFQGFYRRDGLQMLLFPQQKPNVCFSKAGGVAKNRQLAETLREQGFQFPLRYDFQWDEESLAWVGTCQEMAPPPEYVLKKAGRCRRRAA